MTTKSNVQKFNIKEMLSKYDKRTFKDNDIMVKICGINNEEDLKKSLKAGANLIGFLVGTTHICEDKVNLTDAKKLIALLPQNVASVAVTHLTNVNDIVELVKELGVCAVQLHEVMPPEDVKKVQTLLPNVAIIKAVHVMDNKDLALQTAKSYMPYVDAILLDSRTTDRLGGTGKVHDWGISQEIVEQSKKPVFLAGGLNPSNIIDAIKKVKPFGVDVNSGVETNNIKDFEKLSQFVKNSKTLSKNIGEMIK